FNTTINGTGWVAVTTHGTPVLLDAAQMPTYADGQSAVCWSTSLHVGVNRTMKAGALIGRGSGEAIQLAFQGQGFVLVQASEGAPVVQAS
ncbi:AIM24 family protein, partial [Nonomuraea sp. KC401]|uniref:AIM24 family protein n=2 Tax=unclassified Nonomuraea TaxID=2593643 RepID=UPI0010FEFDEF